MKGTTMSLLSSLVNSVKTHALPFLHSTSSSKPISPQKTSSPPSLLGGLGKIIKSQIDQIAPQWIQSIQNQKTLAANPGLQKILDGQATLKKSPTPSKETGIVQDLLRMKGYPIDDQKGTQRGYFGEKTEAALKKYQADHKLTADGIVGKKTLASLLSVEASKTTKTSSVEAKTKAPASAKEFIDRYASYAIESQKQTGVPASVTLAQAALESNWGKSAPGYNFFGVKGTGPAGSQSLKTWEVVDGKKITVSADFRKYNNPAESFVDHANVIANSRYLKQAMDHTDSPFAFIESLQSGKAKYATDPDYVKKITSIINSHELEKYDEMARASAD